MSNPNERGARTERGSALWGTGGRGGDRSSVLWGKGGRGAATLFVLACALMLPLAASAGGGNKPAAANNFIAPTLLNSTSNKVDVIVSYQPSLDASGQGQ